MGIDESSVRIVGIGSSPIGKSRNGRAAGGLGEERAGGELGWTAESVKESKQMNIDEVVDDVLDKTKGAGTG
jgi:hypothetical protein